MEVTTTEDGAEILLTRLNDAYIYKEIFRLSVRELMSMIIPFAENRRFTHFRLRSGTMEENAAAGRLHAGAPGRQI